MKNFLSSMTEKLRAFFNISPTSPLSTYVYVYVYIYIYIYIHIYIYIYFKFGREFCGFFLCHFQKLQLLVRKKLELNFAALYSYFYQLKKVSRIFEILFQTGDNDILVLVIMIFMVSFLVNMFNFSSFLDEKNISGEI